MKKLNILILSAFVSFTVFGQTQYEVFSEKPNERTYKGILSLDIIQKDSFFHYADNLKGYTPNSSALSAFRQNTDTIQVLAFLGTWCDDSQFIIPKLFTLLDSARFPMENVTLIGVDRKKKTISHLSDAFKIKHVPTLIVMKDGKEIGRVVEYGKSGMFDKELGDIISGKN
jgi:thiol-disulfide isomerase/thioredoxin